MRRRRSVDVVLSVGGHADPGAAAGCRNRDEVRRHRHDGSLLAGSESERHHRTAEGRGAEKYGAVAHYLRRAWAAQRH